MKALFLKSVLLTGFTAFLFSCDPDDPSPNNNNNNATPTAQFTATIDGSSYEMKVFPTGQIQQGYSESSSIDSQTSPVTTTASWGSSMYNYVTNESAEIMIGELTWSGSLLPAYNNWKSLFSLGSKNYAFSNGVRINISENGEFWSTSNGSADQSGSTFTITSMEESTVGPNKYIEIEATFTCTLYDNSGASKSLTNGYFNGKYEYAQ